MMVSSPPLDRNTIRCDDCRAEMSTTSFPAEPSRVMVLVDSAVGAKFPWVTKVSPPPPPAITISSISDIWVMIEAKLVPLRVTMMSTPGARPREATVLARLKLAQAVRVQT